MTPAAKADLIDIYEEIRYDRPMAAERVLVELRAATRAVARRSADRGYPIELIDAPAFLEALKIAQLQRPEEVMELKPWEAVER